MVEVMMRQKLVLLGVGEGGAGVRLGRSVGVSAAAAGAQPARRRMSRRVRWIFDLRIVYLESDRVMELVLRWVQVLLQRGR
jgi:hypothetical protein